jgi:hypothetical protein
MASASATPARPPLHPSAATAATAETTTKRAREQTGCLYSVGEQVVFAANVIYDDNFGKEMMVKERYFDSRGKIQTRTKVYTKEERHHYGLVGPYTDWAVFSPLNIRHNDKFSIIGTITGVEPDNYTICIYDITWTNPMVPGVEINTKQIHGQIQRPAASSSASGSKGGRKHRKHGTKHKRKVHRKKTRRNKH